MVLIVWLVIREVVFKILYIEYFHCFGLKVNMYHVYKDWLWCIVC